MYICIYIYIIYKQVCIYKHKHAPPPGRLDLSPGSPRAGRRQTVRRGRRSLLSLADYSSRWPPFNGRHRSHNARHPLCLLHRFNLN